MPILLVRTEEGRWSEVLLNRLGGRDEKTPPLTLGPGPDSNTHIHLPPSAAPGRLIGSGVSLAYSFILQADRFNVNGRLSDGLRVLRHGDRFSLGEAEMQYLEFGVRKIGPGSRLANEKCTTATCIRSALAEGDEYVLCPWCGGAYHAGCWMATEKCSGQTKGCYPVRRVLMRELSDKLRIEKMPDRPEPARFCTAGCEEVNPRGETLASSPLQIGHEYLPCPNPDCHAPYHVQCLLRARGPCPTCDFDIKGMIDSRLARNDKGVFSL